MITTKAKKRLHTVQESWLGTPYSAHLRMRGMGIGCYNLMACLYDTLYRRPEPTLFGCFSPNIGACSNEGRRLVLAFRRNFPLKEIKKSEMEPGDLVVCRSVAGAGGPDWVGHAMMVGVTKGQVLHVLPHIGVVWGSLYNNIGRIVKVYQPQDKETWA